MAIVYDQDVQLRISTKVDGQRDVEALSGSVEGLEQDLAAATEAARESAARQADVAARLAEARQAQDSIRLALASARNEYKFLADRARESGAAQSLFAEQAEAAGQRVGNLKTDLAVASGNVRSLAKEQRSAASDSRAFATAQDRLADELARTVRESKAAAIAAYEEGEARERAARDAEAANRRLIESQRQSAIAAQKAAEYTRWWETELQKVDDAQAAAARQSANLDAAMRKLGQGGASSADKIRAEILEVNQAMLTLARSAKVTGDDFDRAFAQGRARIAELEAKLRGTADGSDLLAQRTSMVSGAIKQLAGAYLGLELARKFIDANVAIESLVRGLTQVAGSSAAAAREIEWLRATTNRLGIDTLQASNAYVSLMASAKGTTLEGQKTRDIFEAVSGAMAKLGKSTADTEGALQAISQMMGKGVVSMEEMRQQLAERLPGAMQATADSLGLTVTELTEMIASGKVLAEDLLPHLTAGLEKMYGTAGKVEGTMSAWNRFKNAINETFQAVGQSGLMNVLAASVEKVTYAVRMTDGAFRNLGEQYSVLKNAVANFDFSRPIESVKEWRRQSVEAGNEIARKMGLAGYAADSAAAAQERLAGKTAAAGGEAAAAGVSWLAVVNAYGKVQTAAEKAVALAEKNAAARAEEAKAALGLANALGTENDKRAAELDAAGSNAAALAAVAAARRNEAAVAQAQAEALRVVAESEGVVSEAKRKAIQDAVTKADALKAEADKASASALAAQQHAAALDTENKALADNSAALVSLKLAADETAAALEVVRLNQQVGTATSEQLAAAELAAAQAAALYRDALADQTAAIQRKADAAQGALDLESATIRLAIEQRKTTYEVAKARGNEATAARAMNDIRQLEIKLQQVSAAAKAAEAVALLEGVKARRAELEAAGAMTVARRAELDAQEQSARVKQVEAQIAAETAKRLNDLAHAAAVSGNASAGAVGGYNALAKSIRGVKDAAEEANDALSSSGSFFDGGRQADRAVDVESMLFAQGASVEEAKAAAKYYGELWAREQATTLTGNLGNGQRAAKLTNQANDRAIKQAIELARAEITTGQAVDLGYSVEDLRKQQLATTRYGAGINGQRAQSEAVSRAGRMATAQPMVIRLSNGNNISFNAASRQDADQVVNLFKQLEASAKTAL